MRIATLTRALPLVQTAQKGQLRAQEDLQSIIQDCEWTSEQESTEAPSAAPSKYIKSKSLINRLLDSAERSSFGLYYYLTCIE